MSICIGALTITGAFSLHMFKKIYIFFFLALLAVTYSMCLWFRDIIVEGTYRGYHTLAVQKGIYIGIALFIIFNIKIIYYFYLII